MVQWSNAEDQNPDECSGPRRREDFLADGLGLRSGASPKFASAEVDLFGVGEKYLAQGGERCERIAIYEGR